ncbi:MAG: DNA polymerase III subunit delta [Clostridia bacterium]|nr:DNA polymerase III subunit delta [Clostridia bacterium]
MSYSEFVKDIKDDHIASLYVFWGRENYLVEHALKLLKDTVVGEAYEAFNYIVLDGMEATVDHVLESAETLPLFAERKVVVVKSAPYFQKTKTGLNDKEEEKFLHYLSSPSASTVVVFISAGDLDKRRKVYKAAQKSGKIVDFDKMGDVDFAKWVGKRFKSEGIAMDSATLRYFVESVGYLGKNAEKTLYEVNSEIDKLVHFTKAEGAITRSHIDTIVEKSFETNIFELLDALSAGDVKTGLHSVHELLETGEAPLKIISMISRQFRMIYKTKALQTEGHSGASIASKLGMPGFVANKNINFGRRMTFDQLGVVIADCISYERMIKTGRMSQEIALETLIVEIIAAIKGPGR